MPRTARRLAFCTFAALAMSQTPAQAATITINVGASQSFANTLVDVIGTFQAYYFASNISYNVAVTVDTNANLKAAIVGTTTPAYDLILTDDSSLIADLTTNYSGYVQGLPFVFAHDRLDLYSVTTDVSKVLTGLPPRFTGPVVIADPTVDAYGGQTANLLAEIPWYITTIPSTRVAVQPDVTTVRAGVDLGFYPYGILAKSAICTNPSGTEVYPEGSYHHEFPPLLGFRYHQIDLSGLSTPLATRTADQVTELSNFVNFLTGVGTTQGTDVLKRSCYLLP
jgi:molybdate transport system substrate-binding protein